MRLLLDESVPRRLRRASPGHSVKTAVEMGWGGVKNGALLVLAAAEFDAFINDVQADEINGTGTLRRSLLGGK
jgi:hypothetical protein